jgi:hypothetical protein
VEEDWLVVVVVVVVVDVDPAVELATYPGEVSPKLLLSDTFAALGALDVLGAFDTFGALVVLGAFDTLGALDVLGAFDILGALDVLGAFDTLGALETLTLVLSVTTVTETAAEGVVLSASPDERLTVVVLLYVWEEDAPVVVDVDPAVEPLLATYPGGVSPKLLLSSTFAALGGLDVLGAFDTFGALDALNFGALDVLGAFDTLGALDVLGAFDTLGALDALTSFGAFAFTAWDWNELPPVLTLEKRGHSVSKGLMQFFSASHHVYPALALQPLSSRSPPTIWVDLPASVRQLSTMNKAVKASKRKNDLKGFICNLKHWMIKNNAKSKKCCQKMLRWIIH